MSDSLERLKRALADRYTIEREVGQGGMATVYLAHDVRHNRKVAVKVLRPELAQSVGPDRFLHEIEIAAKLTHPHILPLYDSGDAEGFLYYVMPYIEGESLRGRVEKEGELPIAEVVRILREVVDALAHAHAQGVVHRDMKPDNVMISGRHALVTDFGVAKAVSEARGGQQLTTVGMALGTPAYMAPEQAAADPDVDHRADVYAIGVMAYELLTGHPPFHGKTAPEVLAAHITQEPEAVSSHRETVPPALADLVMRCLAKRPADRWQSAEEMLPVLDSLATSSGGVTPTATRRVPAFATSRRLRTGLAAAAVLAVAAVAFLVTRTPGIEGDPRKSIIVFPFENGTGDAANDWIEDAAMNSIGLALAHWEDLRVFDDERTNSLMRRREVRGAADLDFDRAQEMAREARVGTLVLGDVRREQGELVIEAKVHDVQSGERLTTEIVRGEADGDPRLLFDSVAARILRVSGAPPGERPGVVAQTTRSIDAYRAYLAGTAALQRFALDSARSQLERAVALDSTFALAYVQLRNVEGWSGLGGGSSDERERLIRQAARYSESLPPRLRLLIQFHSAYEGGRLLRARQLAEELIARDSGDVEAWYQLGEAHYHDRSQQFPRADSAGNLGTALRAFQHTLALDSSYALAYQHIIDVLAACGNSRPWVCLADSAVYGSPEALNARLGAATVERARQDARDELVRTGYAWIAALPDAPRARLRLVSALLEARRWSEAEGQVRSLRDLGDSVRASGFEARIRFAERRFGEAASLVHEALLIASDEEVEFFSPTGAFGQAPDILLSGGRVAAFRGAAERLLTAVPVEEIPLDPTFSIPKETMLTRYVPFTVAILTADSASISNAGAEWLAAIREVAGRDTARLRAGLRADANGLVLAYLMGGDTTLLQVAATWGDSLDLPLARAHLALSRGDTARARAAVAQQSRGSDRPATGDQFLAVYARGNLQARLGDLTGAIASYTQLDSANVDQVAALLVRSWAERGGLYQRLGDDARAIEMYEKFVDAWAEADEELQPMVDRARAALAELRGETPLGERGQ